jgi:hypothetical protein
MGGMSSNRRAEARRIGRRPGYRLPRGMRQNVVFLGFFQKIKGFHTGKMANTADHPARVRGVESR